MDTLDFSKDDEFHHYIHYYKLTFHLIFLRDAYKLRGGYMFGSLKALAGIKLAESFIDNCVRDKVPYPEVGSIVYCDLAFGHAEHSGIYVGGNEIIHLNKKGWIEYVTPQEFIYGTTAISIYTSCRNGRAIGDKYAADNARRFEKNVSVKSYHVLLDNCHMFSSACISGIMDNSDSFLWMLKHTAENELLANEWRVWDTLPKYGALAHSKSTGEFHYSWGAGSTEQAKRLALKNASDDSEIICWTGGSKWIAVAANEINFGWDYDKSKKEACEKARKACGDNDARVILCYSTEDGFNYEPS